MIRILRCLGLAAALLAAAGAAAQTAPRPPHVHAPKLRVIGDKNCDLQPTDVYVALQTALSAPRTCTLPYAASVPAGTGVTVADDILGITATNTLTLAPKSGDTINRASSYPPLAAAGGSITFISNGAKNWQVYAPATVAAAAAGQILAGNASNVTVPATVANDCTAAVSGTNVNFTCTKTNGSSFAAVATSGSATDLGTGTLPAGRLPNPSASTLGGVKSGSGSGNQFQTGIDTSGNPTFAQPAFSNLSGAATGSQLPNPGASSIGGVQSHDCGSQFIQKINTDGTTTCAAPAGSVTGVPAAGNVTPNTINNFTTETLLQYVNAGTGAFNTTAQDVRSYTSGVYSTTGTPTLRLRAKLCSSAPSGTTFTGCINLADSGAITMPSGASSLVYAGELKCGTATTGASGALYCHFEFKYDSGSGHVETLIADTNTSTVGTFDLTGATYVAWSAAWGTPSSSNQLIAQFTNAGSLGMGGTVQSVTPGTGMTSSTGGAIITTGTLNVDVGTSASKIVQLNGSAQLPAVDGSLLTGIPGSWKVTTFCRDSASCDNNGNTGTFTKASTSKVVIGIVCGAGGGGGGGTTTASGTANSGGAGGGGGSCSPPVILRASDVKSSVTVTLGAGGTAGGSGANGGNGSNSTADITTTLTLTGYGGGGGQAGQSNASSTGGQGADIYAAGAVNTATMNGFGGAGSSGAVSVCANFASAITSSPMHPYAGAGAMGGLNGSLGTTIAASCNSTLGGPPGGPGGGVSTTPNGRNGNAGGKSAGCLSPPSGGTGDTTGSANGTAGGTAVAPVYAYLPGCGGAGGGGAKSASFSAGGGSAGTASGGGGGGGSNITSGGVGSGAVGGGGWAVFFEG